MNERWVAVADFEGLYEVSDLGRVRSLNRHITHRPGRKVELRLGRILRQSEEAKGYLFVTLCKDGRRKRVKVHHLAARAFLPASDKPQINHKDFDKKHNAASNLEWATPKENTHHRLVGEPGLNAARASERMQALYASRAKPARVPHPKVKTCTACGASFAPPINHRARAKTCSTSCANQQRGITGSATKALLASA